MTVDVGEIAQIPLLSQVSFKECQQRLVGYILRLLHMEYSQTCKK